MAISAAERNRRKRERKKKEKKEQEDAQSTSTTATNGQQQQQQQQTTANGNLTQNEDVEIEYVVEAVAVQDKSLPNVQDSQRQELESAVRKFQERAIIDMTADNDAAEEEEKKDDTAANNNNKNEYDSDDDDSDEEDEDGNQISKRKLREMIRPSLASLKRRVQRPDLVEAHDVTAFDPDFLIELKAVPGTVPVPRHWGRKRKYLQGKRGFEKNPFKLPDFIVKTGISEVRDTLNETEAGQSAKQRNRSRVAPKMGAIDIDYRTLHDAFFKHQSKPDNLTKIGDTYYEGKELETNANIKPGGPLSEGLRIALGMTDETTSPPPWLNNMQRYGPPPSYPHLKIPGLNAQLPNDQCQYGYHPGGWGKPPVDPYGRPLYGGNPFDPPGKASNRDGDALLVTSNGKTLAKSSWGALPEAQYGQQDDSDEEESSDDEMDESESEEEEGEVEPMDATESVLPAGIQSSAPPLDLRKQPGDITPMVTTVETTKQLYQVLPQAQANADSQAGAVFASNATYVLPTAAMKDAPDGIASVLSKGVSNDAKKKDKSEDKEDTEKTFKF